MISSSQARARNTARFHRFYRLVCKDRICVYCGVPSTTVDHFVPLSALAMSDDLSLNVTGKFLLPSCRECNSLAGKYVFLTVASKRRFIHAKLRKRYASALRIPYWHEYELEKLGHAMRDYVLKGLVTKLWVNERLEWRNTSNREAVKLAAIRSSLAVNGSSFAV